MTTPISIRTQHGWQSGQLIPATRTSERGEKFVAVELDSGRVMWIPVADIENRPNYLVK